MFDLDPDATASTARSLEATRNDPRLQQVRNRILHAVSRVMDTWSQDTEMATVSLIALVAIVPNEHAFDQVLSAFTKAITASPSLQTLISLPPSPLLYMIGSASQKSYSALWPSIASALIFRLAPSPFFRRKIEPGSQDDLADQAEQAETLRIVVLTTDILIRATANVLQDPAALQAVSQLVRCPSVGILRSPRRIPTWRKAFSNTHQRYVNNQSLFYC